MCRRQASKDAISRRGNQGWWLVDWTGPFYGALSGSLVVALVIYVALDQKRDGVPGFNFSLKVQPTFATLPLVPGGKWAFVVPIFEDSAPSLTYAKAACVVLESARRTRTKAKHFVALVSEEKYIPRESLLVLEHCGAQIVRAGPPVDPSILNKTDPLYMEQLGLPGEAGVGFREFHKLNAWRLTQFSSVIVLDTDQLVNRNVDQLFKLSAKFAYSDGNYERLNGGFFVAKPSMSAYMQMVHLIKIPGAYRKQNGWFGTGSTGFASATLQGFLFYFWAYKRPAQTLLLDRCFWNRQIHWGTRNQGCWPVNCDKAHFLHMISCPGKGASRINGRYYKPYEVTEAEIRYLLIQDYMGLLDPPLRSECICALGFYLPIRNRVYEETYKRLAMTNKHRPHPILQSAMKGFAESPTETDLQLLQPKSSAIDKVAFLKTHKTGSTTLGNIFFRYGVKHDLEFYTEGRHVLHCENNPVDNRTGSHPNIILHHVANFPLNRVQFCFDKLKETDYLGNTGFSRLTRWYESVIPGTKLVTIFREPISNYLSHFYFFYEPYHRSDPMIMEGKDYPLLRKYVGEKKGGDILQKELGLMNSLVKNHTVSELHYFLDHELERIDVIMLTDKFDLSLVVMRHTLGWKLEDLAYLRIYNTKSGTLRNLIGRPLKKAPSVEELDNETLERIKILTKSDGLIYEKSKSILMKRVKLLEASGVDVFGELKTLKQLNQKLEKECALADLNKGADAMIVSKCDLFSLKDVAYEQLIDKGIGDTTSHMIKNFLQ